MIIKVKKVTKDCLQSISYELKEGCSYKIITESDRERKLLLDTMLGIQKPDTGKVFIFNKEIFSIPEKELEELFKKVAVVWRYGGLLSNLTIWDNIMLPIIYHREKDPKEMEEKAIQLCKIVGIDIYRGSEFSKKLSGSLSIDEKRLISFIRAFLIDPDIILYDSVFEGFDQKLVDVLLKLTHEFHTKKSGRTSVFIHSYSEEIYCKGLEVDIVLRQSGGKLIPS